jgi:hypothetical protein
MVGKGLGRWSPAALATLQHPAADLSAEDRIDSDYG